MIVVLADMCACVRACTLQQPKANNLLQIRNIYILFFVDIEEKHYIGIMFNCLTIRTVGDCILKWYCLG